MLDDFMVRATLAACGVALASGPLGCFVVWRRMAYYGDATAHAAILGVALSFAISIPVFAGVAGVALVMALLVNRLSKSGQTVDALLGVFSHGALAAGLVAVTLIPGTRINLDAYLFGDVLTVSRMDIAVIWAGAGVVLAVLAWWWNRLLTATLSPDLAFAAGINPAIAQLVLTLLLAMVVAVAIKVVGALLITALLVIPAATARTLARTPERMAALSAIFGVLAALGGLQGAVVFDTPAGPTIVCLAVASFAIATLGAKLAANRAISTGFGR